MLEEDGHAEVRCHFCNTAELVLRDELVALLERHAAGRQA
jgi:redox-regulated HSP33 family molecular chaperone